MAHDTSAHGGSLSADWTDAGQHRTGLLSRWHAAGLGWWIDWVRGTGEAAPLHLVAFGAVAGFTLGLTIAAAYQAVADAGPGGIAALPLAVLTTAGILAARLGLQPGARKQAPEPSPLLAQMQHELRTPLNAVIGFSEAMLHELHGPLGNARYREYAAHIHESGGRLLKASEDAIAVVATMRALATDRSRPPAAAPSSQAAAQGTPVNAGAGTGAASRRMARPARRGGFAAAAAAAARASA